MPEMVAPAVFDLLASPERLALMSHRAKNVGRPRTALDIAEYVLNHT